MDEQKEVVKQEEMTTPESKGIVSEEAVAPAQSTQAGDKTDPNLLLKSLREEREKRKLLEEELNTIKSSVPSESVPEEAYTSDEAKLLAKEIASLKGELSTVKGELSKKDVLMAHPELQDKWEELETFRQLPENKGMNLRTAAKSFLIEKGFMEPARKGLEKSTGGPRTSISSGMSAEDVKTLRETNFKKYQDMLTKGQIKIA